MSHRRIAFGAAILVAGASLTAAAWLPIVFVVVYAGGAFQFGVASPIEIAPRIASALVAVVLVGSGAALVIEPRRQFPWLITFGGGLLGSALLATVYTLSPIARFGFHPWGTSAVAISGCTLGLAAWIGRPAHVRFRFGLGTLLLALTMAAMIFIAIGYMLDVRQASPP